MNMDQDILLQMTDITKTFPGVKALDHVSLTLKRGTVHALMGENGAGKSTLMKCLFGIYNKDSGTILLEGKEVNFKNTQRGAGQWRGHGPSGAESGSEALMLWTTSGWGVTRSIADWWSTRTKCTGRP